jgi:hypothetical protein
MSNVPAAARRQVDEANRMVAELRQQQGAPAQDGNPANPAPNSQATAPAPAQPGLAPPAAAQVQPETPDQVIARLQARYDTLAGKYNAETGQLRDQLNQANRTTAALLEREQPPAPAAAAPAPAPLTPVEQLKALGITDKQIEDYGDLLPLVAQMASNMYKPTIAKLENELNAMRQATGQVSKTLVESKQNDVFDALDRGVPTWRKINEDPHFLDWLNITDIFAGVTRRVALSSAWNALDSQRVVGIFQAYTREHPEAARTAGGPTIDPATLVAPQTRGGEGGGAPEGAGGKRQIHESEIAEFYTRVRKRLVKPDDYARLSAEYSLAASEGRVIPTRRDFHGNAR